MEKKLILLSHICSIEYMVLVLWLWSLKSNGNAYSTKNRPFWSSSYLATSITFLPLSIFFLCYVYYRMVQNYMARFNLAIENMARFKCS